VLRDSEFYEGGKWNYSFRLLHDMRARIALASGDTPLKPLDRLQPYSPGITVERPEPVGDYRVPDGRHLAGLTGRLVELLTEPVPTTCLAM
jgi:glycogen(starch) synthase